MRKIAVFILSSLLLTSCVFDWKSADLEPWNPAEFPEFSILNVALYPNLEFELSFDVTIENESLLDSVGAFLDDQFFRFERDGNTNTYFAGFISDQPRTIYVVPCASVKGRIYKSKQYKVDIDYYK